MFRIKISLAIVLLVLGALGYAYMTLTQGVGDDLLGREVDELSMASRVVASTKQDADRSLVAMAEELSRRPELVKRFQENLSDIEGKLQNAGNQQDATRFFDDTIRNSAQRATLWKNLRDWRESKQSDNRDLASSKLDQFNAQNLQRAGAWFGQAPEFVVAFQPVVGTFTLVVFAENEQEAAAGRKYPFPQLERVAKTMKPVLSVLKWDINSLEYVVAFVPVINPDSQKLIGVIGVGYLLNSELVDRVGAVLNNRHSLVLSRAGFHFQTSAPDDIRGNQLASKEFNTINVEGDVATKAQDTVSFDKLVADQPYFFQSQGGPYLVQKVNLGEEEAGALQLLVAADHTQAMQPLDRIKMTLPLTGGLLLIVTLLVVLLLIHNFLKPLEELDVGIQEVLNGNKEYIFTPRSGHALHAELAASLNQMIAFLQGKAAPGEEDWDELLVDLEPERPSYYGLQAVQIIDDNSEGQRLKDLYQEYMTKRQANGQDVDMDFDRFVRRIKRNEEKLKNQHGCSAVEFSVAVSDGKVVLKPNLRYDS